tara:strand:+ start:258 stop:686 length:429 start_codon:yes stop_codon:yes gene_type:complete
MADKGYGVKFYIKSSSESISDFTEIGEITDITPPSITKDTIETTSHGSSQVKTYIGGLIDFGEVSVTVNYDPDGATITKFRNLAKLAGDGGTDSDFKVEYPDSSTEEFSGIVTGFEQSAPMDGVLSATFTIKVTGSITYSTT